MPKATSRGGGESGMSRSGAAVVSVVTFRALKMFVLLVDKTTERTVTYNAGVTPMLELTVTAIEKKRPTKVVCDFLESR